MRNSIFLPILAAVTSADIGTGPGPHLQAPLFEAANQHPNATGTKPILGINVTLSPYTGQPEEWTAFINVTEVSGDTSVPASEVVTNTVFSFNSNGNFVEAPMSNFNTCVVVMTDVARNATVKGQDDKGLCIEAFGQKCVADWESAIGSARALAANRNNTSGACGGLIMPAIPASCAGSFTTNFFSFDINQLNQTIGEGIIYSTSEPHNASNLTTYEEAVTHLWPTVLIQSPSNQSAGLYSAQLSCLRAGKFSKGSKKVIGVPSASSRMQIDGWGLMGVAAMIATFL